jgi:hypothetical protein
MNLSDNKSNIKITNIVAIQILSQHQNVVIDVRWLTINILSLNGSQAGCSQQVIQNVIVLITRISL